MQFNLSKIKKLKVAIVGCGQIADGHITEIQKLANALIVGVCDSEPIMAEQLALRFGITAHFSDFNYMLTKTRPDVIHICTPPASHPQLCRTAMDSGCHVYVEKPMAPTYSETVDMLTYAARAGRKITVGHNYDFDPPWLEVRRLAANGVLGEPLHIESWFGYNMDGPFGKLILSSPDHWVHRLPGKIFQNNISHLVSKICTFLDNGKPQVKAMAWQQRRRARFDDLRDELFDELRVIIRGQKVSAYGTFSANVRPVAHFSRVYGSKGIVHADFISRTATMEKGAVLPSAIGRLAAGFSQTKAYAKASLNNLKKFVRSDFHYFTGMNNLIQMFYDSILLGTSPPIPHEKIVQTAWILEEIFSQIRETPK